MIFLPPRVNYHDYNILCFTIFIVVKWKVRDTSPKLGQHLILFCKVDSCTVDEIRRWYGGPDNKPLMSSSGISTDKAKYHTTSNADYPFGIVNLYLSIIYPLDIGDLSRF
jgi:hypothetical protein